MDVDTDLTLLLSSGTRMARVAPPFGPNPRTTPARMGPRRGIPANPPMPVTARTKGDPEVTRQGVIRGS